MNKFIEKLEEKGLLYMLEDNYSDYSVPNIALVKRFVDDFMSSPHSRVYIHGDRDVDGIIAALEIQEMCERIGYTNYYIPVFSFKSHNVESKEMYEMLNGNFTHVIIVDSSTNDFELHERLISAGIKLLIIDHHMPQDEDGRYSKFILVNCKLNSFLSEDKFTNSSAGMLCYFVVKDILREYNCVGEEEMLLYAYVTMYSDVMNMSDKYNIGLSQKVLNYEGPIPRLLTLFQNSYYPMSKNFVSYSFANKLNALLRMNRYDIVDELVYKLANKTQNEINILMKKIEAIANQASVMEKEIVDAAIKNNLKINGDFVILDITEACKLLSKPTSLLANFTGLIANGISDKYKKPCLTIVLVDRMYKGSIRDIGDCELLDQMSYFMNAEGHKSAFGVKFSPLNLELVEDFLLSLRCTSNRPDPIVVDSSELDIQTLKKTIKIMADYNEYSGNNIPQAYFLKKVEYNNHITSKARSSVINYGGLEIVCFNPEVKQGSTLLIKPTLGIKNPKLIAEKLLV